LKILREIARIQEILMRYLMYTSLDVEKLIKYSKLDVVVKMDVTVQRTNTGRCWGGSTGRGPR